MMADQETEPTVNPVEPAVIEPAVEPAVEPVIEPGNVGDVKLKEPGTEKSIVARIGDILSDAKNRLTGGDNADTSDETDIPDEFIVAMTAAGYDDTTIKEFAGSDNNGEPFTNEQLIEMIPSLTKADPVKTEEPAKEATEKVEPGKEEEVENSQDGEELKQALDRIAALEKAQGVNEELAGFVDKASDLFDKASEEFEVFGKTDSLPTFPDGVPIPTSPQMKARNEVWDMAIQLKEAGMSNDKALEFSLNAYKGAHLATETKRNVIKELKKGEQRLGGKRTSHEMTGSGGKELSGPEVIKEVARRHGHEMRD